MLPTVFGEQRVLLEKTEPRDRPDPLDLLDPPDLLAHLQLLPLLHQQQSLLLNAAIHRIVRHKSK
jgi:hypothetical protein